MAPLEDSTGVVGATTLEAFSVTFPDQVEQELGAAYGEPHWTNIKRALARPPSYTAVRVNTLQLTRDEALRALQPHIDGFNAQLAALDASRRPIEAFAHESLPDVLMIPSAASGEDAVEYNAELKSIVVDRLCGEAVLRGSDIFARGVMSASSGINAEDEVNVFVDLDHNHTRGSDFAAHNGRKLLIARGVTKMARTEIFRAVRGLAVTQLVRVCPDAPPMNGVLRGQIYVQNLPCSVVAHALDPQEGDVILDMCAAPGGKTSHVATLMRNRGTLVACDRSKRKALELRMLCEELELSCVVPLKMDSTHSVLPKDKVDMALTDTDFTSVAQVLARAKENTPNQARLLQVEGFFPETFDRILLDPPCSALGLRPRLLHAGDADNLAEYTNMQRNFLWCAAFLLKPGGTLVYSTCTINPKENEQMVHHALQNYPFELVSQGEAHIGDRGLAGQGLNEHEASLVQRFDPSNTELDTMGFFCAKFVKTGSIRQEQGVMPQAL
ncbi:putative methyltransferase nsun6 [Phytophthora boehmeriae]|uniref:Putative methyltransferase nsun6 n=1 Tax=Phytophthora boehmeriae TaxID=109152 RepID=A0A8T1VXB7_9STRA|nr:putative methyltransferase nsun6 [Phytophthora boehmeriae]